jgi:site-specific recombinase XerD
MVDHAAALAGILDHREPGYQELPEHADAERFYSIATGKLVRLDIHLEEYLATLGERERKTVDMKRSTIKKFCAEFAYIADVKRKEVQQWANRQAQDGKKPATIVRSLSELRGYWGYLMSIEVVPEAFLVFDKLSLPRAGKNGKADERTGFEPADVVRLLKAAREDREDEPLARLIELGMYTGARIEELCTLPVAKVSSKGYIEIEDAKTPAGWRQVPIHSKLKATIEGPHP